jgi:hypothetical protein
MVIPSNATTTISLQWGIWLIKGGARGKLIITTTKNLKICAIKGKENYREGGRLHRLSVCLSGFHADFNLFWSYEFDPSNQRLKDDLYNALRPIGLSMQT